jgi:hypothetical protein
MSLGYIGISAWIAKYREEEFPQYAANPCSLRFMQSVPNPVLDVLVAYY